jgi:hypothetical protein
MPRFVILTHDHPFLHLDLMLERGGVLKTWRLLEKPDAPGKIRAEPLPDHRSQYLDYEGPVSGNRGEVRRWDAGEYEAIEEAPDRVEVRLNGEKLAGRAVLAAEEPGESWAFYFFSDQSG